MSEFKFKLETEFEIIKFNNKVKERNKNVEKEFSQLQKRDMIGEVVKQWGLKSSVLFFL